MREILFRGKTYDGIWVAGSYYKQTEYYGYPCEKHIIISSIDELEDNMMHYYLVVPETVGQFTGLYDKNDTKICEGDIVKTKFGRLCTVIWFSNQAHSGWDLELVLTCDNCVHTEPPTAFDLYRKDNLEVVGNIHDNPELVGGK